MPESLRCSVCHAVCLPDILAKVVKTGGKPYRPQYTSPPPDADAALLQLMSDCWAEAPGERPNAAQIRKSIVRINSGK